MYSKRTKVHEWMHLSESSYGKHQCVIRHPETKTMQETMRKVIKTEEERREQGRRKAKEKERAMQGCC